MGLLDGVLGGLVGAGINQMIQRNGGVQGLVNQFEQKGLGGIALASLMLRDAAAAPVPGEASDRPPHHPARAKRAIQIFLQGGLSQVDSFDYKPELERLHGKPPPQDAQGFMGRVGRLHKAHFTFRKRGQSGLWVSDLFPHLAEVADELTVIRSMWAGTGNHTPATYKANSGFRTLGFHAAGTWISYGLGCEVDNLPTFVVLPDSRSLPTGASTNWSAPRRCTSPRCRRAPWFTRAC